MKIIKITRKDTGEKTFASNRSELSNALKLSQQRISTLKQKLIKSGIATTKLFVLEIVDIPDVVIKENI